VAYFRVWVLVAPSLRAFETFVYATDDKRGAHVAGIVVADLLGMTDTAAASAAAAFRVGATAIPGDVLPDEAIPGPNWLVTVPGREQVFYVVTRQVERYGVDKHDRWWVDRRSTEAAAK